MASNEWPTFKDACEELAKLRIGFQCGFPDVGDNRAWTIQITQSVNNVQLRRAVDLGGNLSPNGAIQIIGSED
jgi:hypothetical protein